MAIVIADTLAFFAQKEMAVDTSDTTVFAKTKMAIATTDTPAFCQN